VLLPSNTCTKPIMSITAGLLPFVTYLLTLPRNLCSSPNTVRVTKSRRMRWVKHVARIGAIRNAYRVLLGKPEGNSPLCRRKHR
jgi:hypothetical protein